MRKDAEHSLKVEEIKKLEIKELTCSKTGKTLPLEEFRYHKGYYMSYCKDWEKDDNKKRLREKQLVNIEIEHNDINIIVQGKKTRSKGFMKITSPYSSIKLYFEPNIEKDLAIMAYKTYAKELRDVKIN